MQATSTWMSVLRHLSRRASYIYLDVGPQLSQTLISLDKHIHDNGVDAGARSWTSSWWQVYILTPRQNASMHVSPAVCTPARRRGGINHVHIITDLMATARGVRSVPIPDIRLKAARLKAARLTLRRSDAALSLIMNWIAHQMDCIHSLMLRKADLGCS